MALLELVILKRQMSSYQGKTSSWFKINDTGVELVLMATLEITLQFFLMIHAKNNPYRNVWNWYAAINKGE